MNVIEQAVDCDVPSKSINKGSTKRLTGEGKGNQRTGSRWAVEVVAYDLVRDPTVLGVFFGPEVYKIQFDIPKFHLGRFEVLGLVGVSFHSYWVLDNFVLVGLEKLSQAIRE